MLDRPFARPGALAELTADALALRLRQLVGDERQCLIAFLWHLAEFDRRRHYAALGYPSLFAYCTGALRLSNAAAFRRTHAARLLARFPVIEGYLADGRLSLTTLMALKDLLDAASILELLQRAAGRSEDEVKLLVAELRPRPDIPDSIRRVVPRQPPLEPTNDRRQAPTPAPAATPATQGASPARQSQPTVVPSAPAQELPTHEHGPAHAAQPTVVPGAASLDSSTQWANPAHAAQPAFVPGAASLDSSTQWANPAHAAQPAFVPGAASLDSSTQGAGAAHASRTTDIPTVAAGAPPDPGRTGGPPPAPARIEPLSADRYSIRLSVSSAFIDDLKQVKAALSHIVPSGKLEEVLGECIRRTLAALVRRRRGAIPASLPPPDRSRNPPSTAAHLAPSPQPSPTTGRLPLFDGPASDRRGSLQQHPSVATPTVTSGAEVTVWESTVHSPEQPTVVERDVVEALGPAAPRLGLSGEPTIVLGEEGTGSERSFGACLMDGGAHVPDEQRPEAEATSGSPGLENRAARGADEEGCRPSRFIPAAVRREVWLRDEGRCTFEGPEGRRCGSTHQLEFHHRIPFARGGPSTAVNLTLHCRTHNDFCARRDLGAYGEAASFGPP